MKVLLMAQQNLGMHYIYDTLPKGDLDTARPNYITSDYGGHPLMTSTLRGFRN